MSMAAAADLGESELIAAARRGEAAAWRTLVAQHGPTIYALCRRLDADPDDAYQEIWEKISRNLRRFEVRGAAQPGLGAWARTLARRHLIDRHRRRSARGEVIAQLTPPEPVSDDGAAEAIVARRERAAKLEAALQRLPPAQRRAVVLHHVEGMALDDIASAEEAAVGTIKSRLHRARARLAGMLGGKL